MKYAITPDKLNLGYVIVRLKKIRFVNWKIITNKIFEFLY